MASTPTPKHRPPGVLTALLHWPDGEGASRSARAALSRWTKTTPELSNWHSPGELVHSIRADAALVVPVLGAVATHTGDPAAGNPVAATTVLSALAPRLAGVVARYRRAGISGHDVETFEADLVAEALALIAAGSCPMDRLVGTAWERARRLRRAERRHAERIVFLPSDIPLLSTWPPHVVDGAVGLLAEGCRTGVVDTASGAALLSKALGFSTGELARTVGCSAEVIRARRSRAARRLALWAAA